MFLRPLHGPQQTVLPAPIRELALVVRQEAEVGTARLVKDAVDDRTRIIAAHPLDDRQPLLVAEARRAQQDKTGYQFGIARRELNRDLAAETVGDEVVRRRLHKQIEIHPQLAD